MTNVAGRKEPSFPIYLDERSWYSPDSFVEVPKENVIRLGNKFGAIRCFSSGFATLGLAVDEKGNKQEAFGYFPLDPMKIEEIDKAVRHRLQKVLDRVGGNDREEIAFHVIVLNECENEQLVAAIWAQKASFPIEQVSLIAPVTGTEDEVWTLVTDGNKLVYGRQILELPLSTCSDQ